MPLLDTAGKDTHGTDFIDLYPQRKDVKKCDIDNDTFPYASETFDEVYSKLVFEHLTNHAHFMREANRVLKPKGTLVIITDNAGLHGLLGKVHQGNYEKVHGKEAKWDRHYALFTPTHLRNFLEKFGFKTKSIEYLDLSKDLRVHLLAAINRKLNPNIIAIGIKQ